jgi:hypothetical protein
MRLVIRCSDARRASLPPRHGAGHDPEQRMRPRSLNRRQPGPPRRIAGAQLLQQVIPLELQLTARDGEPARGAGAMDLPPREPVATVHGLRVNGPEVLRHEPDGGRPLPEPDELRVMTVSAPLPREHGLRE